MYKIPSILEDTPMKVCLRVMLRETLIFPCCVINITLDRALEAQFLVFTDNVVLYDGGPPRWASGRGLTR